ncbi:hypothetical protein [Caulobacter segnis]|uniref:hypothetical protein n=1 Tax=Caulobacter segnis TaxID=88688 RepID=UPI001CBDB507|nr:hypothetical protein [Caulobacter segnis]UAL10194.1 hypothetical protein K8940_20890 [Caulobacter segnis]
MTRAAPFTIEHFTPTGQDLPRRAGQLQGRILAARELCDLLARLEGQGPCDAVHRYARANCEALKRDLEALLGEAQASGVHAYDLGFF